ncbi:MAG: hypothetical protein HY958_10315 [Bacteroidia bacterium]|nr:hypothetical protein [Bacteroidia bacterium]
MLSVLSGKLVYFQFENLKNFNRLNHFVSSRTGGFSAAPFDTLNLG